jgi:hypothetical protein
MIRRHDALEACLLGQSDETQKLFGRKLLV